MKVLHISETVKGGIATYLNEIYSNKIFGTDINFFLPLDHKEYVSNQILNDGKVIFFNRKQRNFKSLLIFFIFIIKNIKKINPDLIHVHSSFAGFIVRFYYFFKFKRPKIVYTSHGWSFLMDVTKIKRKIYLIIEKILSIKTDLIINISNYEYIESIRLGISNFKSVKVLNSINNKVKIINKHPLNYHKNKINFLFIGRLDPEKGFDKLYNYFSLNTKHVLHVVGDTVTSKSFNSLNKKNIYFYGWQNYENIHNYYIQSDVVIIPSKWEGFGLVALEAMKYSKPILASNRGALIDIIEDNKNGFIFDFNNFNSTLTKSINDLIDADIKKIGRSSYQLFSEKYSKNNMSKEINDLYEKLLK